MPGPGPTTSIRRAKCWAGAAAGSRPADLARRGAARAWRARDVRAALHRASACSCRGGRQLHRRRRPRRGDPGRLGVPITLQRSRSDGAAPWVGRARETPIGAAPPRKGSTATFRPSWTSTSTSCRSGSACSIAAGPDRRELGEAVHERSRSAPSITAWRTFGWMMDG